MPWQEVDLWNQQVTIGAAGDTKTGRHRAVNFTPELKGLLHEMNNTRAPDSSFLFPSRSGASAIFPPKVCENLLSWCAPRPGATPRRGVVGPRTAKGIPWPRCWPLR